MRPQKEDMAMTLQRRRNTVIHMTGNAPDMNRLRTRQPNFINNYFYLDRSACECGPVVFYMQMNVFNGKNGNFAGFSRIAHKL